jgi:hypothetical protein
VEARVLRYLRPHGREATCVGRDHPGGISDAGVLATLLREDRVLTIDGLTSGNWCFAAVGHTPASSISDLGSGGGSLQSLLGCRMSWNAAAVASISSSLSNHIGCAFGVHPLALSDHVLALTNRLCRLLLARSFERCSQGAHGFPFRRESALGTPSVGSLLATVGDHTVGMWRGREIVGGHRGRAQECVSNEGRGMG